MSRSTLGLTGLVAGALVMSGCVADVPAPVTSAPPLTEAASLLEAQSTLVIEETMAELAAADKARDIELLSNRIGGDAKKIRDVEYTLAKADDGPDVTSIPSSMQAVYVSGAQTWPRTLVAVTEQADEDTTPVVLLWVQEDIDDDYQLRGWAHMIPGATLPAMPGTLTGAEQFEITSTAFAPSPEQTITDYVTLLKEGSDSDLDETFGADSYRERLFTARKTLTEAAEDSDGEYKDEIAVDLEGAYAMGTASGGVLVFTPLSVSSTFTVEDATVSIPESDEPLLEGDLDDTVTHEYLDMIVMYIPGPGDGELPTVVAAEHNLIKVSDS